MEELVNDKISTEPQTEDVDTQQKKKNLRRLTIKLGFIVIIMFTLRIISSILIGLIYPQISSLPVELSYAIQTVISILFVMLLPLFITHLILKNEPTADNIEVIKKPKYLNNALWTIPALYGTSLAVNLIVMKIAEMITKNTDLMDSFNTINDIAPASFGASLILFAMLIIAAPICEEIWFRGIIFRRLYPYGSGFAIITSAFLFGLAHANFQQFFYTFFIGVALAYITYATKSIVASMIIHAIYNSIAGILILFISTEPVKLYLENNMSEEYVDHPLVIGYIFFAIFIIILILVGLSMLITKLIKAKRYRTPTIFPQISLGKKLGIFFSSITLIVGLLIAADVFTYNNIARFFFNILKP